MSTAALLWTHNEPDVLFDNIRHLLDEVDEILIRDRASTPEVRAQLDHWAKQNKQIYWRNDDSGNVYDQSAMMTEMAQEARERGHEWVIPIDPDELWYSNDRPMKEALGGMSKDVAVVKAELFNHVVSALDPEEGSPFERIGWRQRFPLSLGKIAARTRPDLVIHHGNHSCSTRGVALAVGPALVVRHFPYRTPDQFVERVRETWEQLKASDQPESFGIHIRAYGRCLEDEGEEALRNHFRHWFYSATPRKDDSLIYDPAPI